MTTETNGVALAEVPRPVTMLRPIAEPAGIIEAQETTRTLIQKALSKGRDYGLIPGTGDKPTLLKPGAERIVLAFGCFARFSIVTQEVEHDRIVNWVKRQKQWRGKQFLGWKEEAGVSLGLYRYVVLCEIVLRETGAVVGSCVASCSTMESKYVERPRDSENTVLKMAEKRALVGATLVTFGLSDQFTQDLDEAPPADSDGVSTAPEDTRPAAAAAPEKPAKPERITRESAWPFGKNAGIMLLDLPADYLVWAIEKGRRLGEGDGPWIASARAELELREDARLMARSAEQSAAT